jgi:hypothetical protein
MAAEKAAISSGSDSIRFFVAIVVRVASPGTVAW